MSMHKKGNSKLLGMYFENISGSRLRISSSQLFVSILKKKTFKMPHWIKNYDKKSFKS